jgi:hypothetical protein
LEFDHYLEGFIKWGNLSGPRRGIQSDGPHLCFFLEGADSDSFFILELPNSILVSSLVGKVMEEFIVVIPIFYLKGSTFKSPFLFFSF